MKKLFLFTLLSITISTPAWSMLHDTALAVIHRSAETNSEDVNRCLNICAVEAIDCNSNATNSTEVQECKAEKQSCSLECVNTNEDL